MARILIVEDYESLRNIYGAALKQAGHRVEVVDDGIVGLQAALARHYDLILLDLLLPHMSGMEFLRKYSPKDHPKTKVIVFSNFASPKYVVEGNELGVRKHLTKSNVSPKELAQVVAETLAEP